MSDNLSPDERHPNRIYILRDGLDPEAEHSLSIRITDKRHELSQGS